MGLLSRRRPDRGADHSPEAASGLGADPAPSESEEAADSEVISASTLNAVPDWATLPPIPPSLPEMPWVVSRHFDESLVSWQPPERFIGTLGHSVSASAPSGVVDGLAVSLPAP